MDSVENRCHLFEFKSKGQQVADRVFEAHQDLSWGFEKPCGTILRKVDVKRLKFTEAGGKKLKTQV